MGEGLLLAGEQANRRATRLFAPILQSRSPLARSAGWELPFYWGGTAKHPPHQPATTTTIALQGGLDSLRLIDRDEALAPDESGKRSMFDECGTTQLPDGECIFCGPRGAFDNGGSNDAVFICGTQVPICKATVRHLRSMRRGDMPLARAADTSRRPGAVRVIHLGLGQCPLR